MLRTPPFALQQNFLTMIHWHKKVPWLCGTCSKVFDDDLLARLHPPTNMTMLAAEILTMIHWHSHCPA